MCIGPDSSRARAHRPAAAAHGASSKLSAHGGATSDQRCSLAAGHPLLAASSVLARQAASVALLAVFMRDSAPSESRKRMAQSL